MKNEFHGVTHITPADGNIFTDLGFPPDEAAKLLAETDKAILDRIAIKESLMVEISSWISSQGLKQVAITKPLTSVSGFFIGKLYARRRTRKLPALVLNNLLCANLELT